MRKKRIIIMFIALTLVLSSCKSDIKVAIPDYEQLKTRLEKKGYEVETFNRFNVDQKEYEIVRLYAENKDDFIDICWDVKEGHEDIMNYYKVYEDDYNHLVNINNTIFCCTKKAMKDSKIKLADIKPPKIDVPKIDVPKIDVDVTIN
ncbi:hypothetical protein I5677_02035 [Mobilitalea sibirica]|uniref:Lipoprotein n=1 Tax=Mobilitalea sibirica TaxID=1462919 RepID=A0A8J7HA73_9FIRM|nr:hypothetical protein [Mobilitalea sibirica]MBH1939671.1 hypothetical protein [Mobilitalea sibirica]